MQTLYVVFASTITALCTGLGVIPFLFSKQIGKRSIGLGSALAAGLMLGASLGLANEAVHLSLGRTAIGLVLGFGMILLTRWIMKLRVPDEGELVAELDGADLRKMILIMTVMTIHSFAEGIGVGVSFGGRENFGEFVSTAIAIHNIPEGLAIGLIMIPRGVSIFKAGLWSIFSSLPQPLVAAPAFLFVTTFAPLLPIGLGLAAGAMTYMVLFELLPEALENESRFNVAAVSILSVAAMLVFQLQIS